MDIDLTDDGPAVAVSRQQAIIKLRADGMFYITNVGKNTFWVTGKVCGPRQLLGGAVGDCVCTALRSSR